MQSTCKLRLQVLLCGCALWFASGIAVADTHYALDIRGAPLSSALKAFAAQTGLQVAYFTRLADGRKAAPVAGSLTAEQALAELLRETGLTFERIDAETIAIRELHNSGDTERALTEVLVTGTHIRGVSNETA